MTVKWNKRGSCGNAGCKDPECCCSLCGLPIGVPETDPRWREHDELCAGCELCRDVPAAIVFQGEGEQMQQAQFHWGCFARLIREGGEGMTVQELISRLEKVPRHLQVYVFDNYDEGNTTAILTGIVEHPEPEEAHVLLYGQRPSWVKNPERFGLSKPNEF